MFLWQESYNDHVQHLIENFLGAATFGLAVIIYLEKRRKDAKKAMDEKHHENIVRLDKQDEKLDEIAAERKYIPAHFHREISGALTAENIYPKKP